MCLVTWLRHRACRLSFDGVFRVTRSDHAKVESACPLKFLEIRILGIISDNTIFSTKNVLVCYEDVSEDRSGQVWMTPLCYVYNQLEDSLTCKSWICFFYLLRKKCCIWSLLYNLGVENERSEAYGFISDFICVGHLEQYSEISIQFQHVFR